MIYGLCKGIATDNVDGMDSRLPTKRMPMGLLQFMSNFYTSGSGEKVFNRPECCCFFLNVARFKCNRLSVLRTTWSGCRPCTVCLALNGPNYTVGQCVLMSLLSRDPRLLT